MEGNGRSVDLSINDKVRRSEQSAEGLERRILQKWCETRCKGPKVPLPLVCVDLSHVADLVMNEVEVAAPPQDDGEDEKVEERNWDWKEELGDERVDTENRTCL